MNKNRKLHALAALILIAILGALSAFAVDDQKRTLRFDTLYTRVLFAVAPEMALHRLTAKAHTSLRYAMPPKGFSLTEAMEKTGTGHCGHISELLRRMLLKYGVSSQLVDCVATTGASHTVLTLALPGQSYVLDPTLNVVYQEKFENLLLDRMPQKLPPDSPEPRFAGYYASSFFPKIIRTDLNPDNFDEMYARIPCQQYATKENIPLLQGPLTCAVVRTGDDCTIFWNKEKQPYYVTFRPPADTRISFKTLDDTFEYRPAYADISSIPVRNADPEKGITLTIKNDASNIDFPIEAIFPREQISKDVVMRSTSSSFISFTEGSLLVDSVKLTGASGKVYWHVKFGDSTSERLEGTVVPTQETSGKAVNDWGDIVIVDDDSFRIVDAAINSLYKQAVVQFSPITEGLEDETSFTLTVCALNRDDSDGRTNISWYYPPEREYIVLGTVPVHEGKQCLAFDLPPRLMAWALD